MSFRSDYLILSCSVLNWKLSVVRYFKPRTVDGSKIGGQSGVDVHLQLIGVSLSVALGEHTTVFQSDVIAIRNAAI